MRGRRDEETELYGRGGDTSLVSGEVGSLYGQLATRVAMSQVTVVLNDWLGVIFDRQLNPQTSLFSEVAVAAAVSVEAAAGGVSSCITATSAVSTAMRSSRCASSACEQGESEDGEYNIIGGERGGS